MKAKIRPGRIIVHLSSYDDSFIKPKRDWSFLKKVTIAVGLLPALTTLITPSYQLAKVKQAPVAVSLPASLKAGEAFVLPVTDGVLEIRLRGVPLPLIEGSNPVYFGSLDLEQTTAVVFDLLLTARKRPKGKTFQERHLTHPTVDYARAVVNVVKAPDELAPKSNLPARVAGNYENEEALHPAQPAEVALKPHTEKISLSCWAPPVAGAVMMPFGVEKRTPDGKRIYRHLGVDLRTVADQAVSSAGAGRVIAVSDRPQPGRTVTISHGGGLFSRYLHLKEVSAYKGMKVKKGERIGSAGPIRRYEAPRVHWEVFFEKKAVDPRSFLELSSQLCDSK